MRLLLILISFFVTSWGTPLLLIDSVPDLQGTEELRHRDYSGAKKMEQRAANTFSLRLFKEAEMAISKKKYRKAIRTLHDVSNYSDSFVPFAYRRIGDIERMQNEQVKSIEAYEIAREKSSDKTYRLRLTQLIDSVRMTLKDTISSSANTVASTTSIAMKNQAIEPIVQRINEGITETQFDSLLVIATKNGSLTDFKKQVNDTSDLREPFSCNRIYDHALFLQKNGFLDEADKWLTLVSKRVGFKDSINQQEYLNARVELSFELKKWVDVIAHAQNYFASFGHNQNIVFKIARAFRNNGDHENADRWYAEHVKLYPSAKETSDILWYLAWRSEEKGELDSAVIRFQSIATTQPTYKYATESAFRVGLNQFRKKSYEDAIKTFTNFSTTYPNSSFLAGASYWIGRSYAALDKKEESEQIFRNTIANWPLEYYAFRSRGWLKMTDQKIIMPPFKPWFEELVKMSAKLDDSVVENCRAQFTAAVQLGSIGYRDEARVVLGEIASLFADSPAQRYEIARLYELLGDYQNSYQMTRNLYGTLPAAMKNTMPVEFLNRLYPLAYPEFVSSATKEFSVDEYLVRSIMRQESMFQPAIVSPVGATGLMQIMNYTGKEIAIDLKRPFQDSMLYNARLNIDFGTYYIGKLLKQFNNDYVKSIASYNGGPHNVKKWIDNNADIVADEPYFTECIGFSETRKYVKKVLENYWMYKSIYGK